ncbi:MAG: GxxExxY protein [Thermodesulfobacteriota bacterium]|nr:GxxExxY protein [Thermodesulfobacteriota bacterium]
METQKRTKGEFLYGDLTNKIIELAIKVHKKLGPGFIEKIYEKALSHELNKEGIKYEKQKSIRVKYDEILLGDQRVDMIIEDKIIVELKAVSELNDIHQAQMLSYLKAADKKVGLILNFGKPKLEIKRVIN